MTTKIAELLELKPKEKLRLLEILWDSLAATPEAVPVHDWQKAELDRRHDRFKKNPKTGIPWEEAKKRIRAKHGRARTSS